MSINTHVHFFSFGAQINLYGKNLGIVLRICSYISPSTLLHIAKEFSELIALICIPQKSFSSSTPVSKFSLASF